MQAADLLIYYILARSAVFCGILKTALMTRSLVAARGIIKLWHPLFDRDCDCAQITRSHHLCVVMPDYFTKKNSDCHLNSA
jgi:hypothetical protein